MTVSRPMEAAPDAISSASFADLAEDPSLPGPDAVFSGHSLRSGNCQYMIRTRQHKYIHNGGSTDELYDLGADPHENVNRIAALALEGVRQDLQGRLFEWFNPAENPFRNSRP